MCAEGRFRRAASVVVLVDCQESRLIADIGNSIVMETVKAPDEFGGAIQ